MKSHRYHILYLALLVAACAPKSFEERLLKKLKHIDELIRAYIPKQVEAKVVFEQCKKHAKNPSSQCIESHIDHLVANSYMCGLMAQREAMEQAILNNGYIQAFRIKVKIDCDAIELEE
jgi:uncharacterized protein YnzC (UPF0291/DUF896 family)